MGSSKKGNRHRGSHKCSDHCCCLTPKSSRKKETGYRKRKSTCFEKDTSFHKKDNKPHSLVGFEANQEFLSNQLSDSIIIVKNSCNVDVNLTDRQTILIFQTFIQLLAIFLLLIGLDTNSIKLFIEEVSQIVKVIQESEQKVIIKNSCHVNVRATHTDTVIFLQSFLQALAVLLAV
ncbi:spore coat protein [Priestia sp. YIM B13489]|uniref:spore coat protein n=1 Tax=Priestia sp. YIM B13489 TaxID=3366313 RepID=UPI00366FED87